MRGKLIGFALALLSVATVGVVQLNANAYVDNTRDCDQYAVIHCGALSPAEAQNKYNEGSRIFNRFGITKAEINNNNMKDGIVYQNGNVMVGGKVVATGARTAIRNMSDGEKIAGTNAAIYPTSRMGSAQTAMVKFDNNGRFLFAIMKPCGNPVIATPTQPKPSAECKNLQVTRLDRTKRQFDVKAEAKDGAKIKSYSFTVKKGGKVVESKTVNSSSYTFNAKSDGDYKVSVTVNTTVGPQNGPHCTKEFTIKPEPVTPTVVCVSLSKEKLGRTKFEFKAKADATRANVTGYLFEVYKGSTRIKRELVSTPKLSANYTYTQPTSGNYSVRVTVKSNLKDVSGRNCVVPFTVNPPTVTPTAACNNLLVVKLSDTSFRFDAAASVDNGAKVTGYSFDVIKAGVVIDTVPLTTNKLIVQTPYNQATPGDYSVRVTVQTTTGPKTSANCVKPFTVDEPPVEENPGINIVKTVEGVKYTRVGVNVEYEYQVAVTNTGDVVLTDSVVTDTPEQGITLTGSSAGTISSNNTWVYTIPTLTVGQTLSYTLTAKVPVYLDGILTNTVCVDNPQIPGTPDDCDEADVDVPTPETPMVPVCNPEDGTIIQVPAEDEDKYAPVDSPKCKDIKVCVIKTKEIKTIKKSDFDSTIHTTDLTKCEATPVQPTPEVAQPTELPTTGAAEAIVQLVGATSLAGAGAYYLTSRRSI